MNITCDRRYQTVKIWLQLVMVVSIVSQSNSFSTTTVTSTANTAFRVPTPREVISSTSISNSIDFRWNRAVENNRKYQYGTTGSRSSQLYSIRGLIDELSEADCNSNQRTVFVGGKGGVGKTTVSSSLAVALASSYTSTQKILVVSTDPAHSLGDALDVDLKTTPGQPIQLTDPLTSGRLYGLEIDTQAALARFQDALSAFDINKLSDALGVPPDLLESLGLEELSGLLNDPPPGLDELVALGDVMNDGGAGSLAKDFDVVIVDTAPTGHTLRMLALPEFLDGFLGKLLELRLKLSGLANTLQAFLGGGEAANTRAQTVDNALNKLEAFRSQMNSLRAKLKDHSKTDFVVVTVPTTLSVNESKRLMADLNEQGIKVSNVVVNQCIVSGGSGDGTDEDVMEENKQAMVNYYTRRKAGQDKWIGNLQDAIQDVNGSDEYRDNGGGSIELTQSPFFDVELVGTPALAYLGQSVYANDPSYGYLMNNDDSTDAKFVICGGKGGVGKTTTSSSLAITMAAAGRNVALVSTDPAHSLGDAFGIDFRGGNMVDVPLIGVPPSDGSLSVLEVDPGKSLGEFKGLIDRLIGSKMQGGDGMDANGDSAGIGKTLRDLGEVFDTLPAGTDEVVALAKVVGLINQGSFDRIVLDTAPTGHTLRMLSTPGFIAELIDRVLAIARKVNSNSMVKMLLAGSAGDDLDETALAAKEALVKFQFQMYDLEELFSNVQQTEFLIVTVPTELAVRESVRLLNDLTFESPDMPIKVRHVVVNQVLKDDCSDVTTFLNRVAQSQKLSIQELRRSAADNAMTSGGEGGKAAAIIQVPYLDTEPRGVFGLKVLADELQKENEPVASSS